MLHMSNNLFFLLYLMFYSISLNAHICILLSKLFDVLSDFDYVNHYYYYYIKKHRNNGL